MQDRKRYETEKETRQKAHSKKTSNHVLLPPAIITWGDKTLSRLPGAPASILQEKHTTQTNQDKHDRKRTARITNNHVPLALTTSRQNRESQASHGCPASHENQNPSHSPPSFSSGVEMAPPQCPQMVSPCACQHRRRTCCRFTSFCGHRTCCRDYRGIARHILHDRRGHERLAAFCSVDGTVRRPHKAWCASALRRALRVCSSTYTLVSVLGLSAVCLSVYVQLALLRGTAVPYLHYSGIRLISAGPAISRALSVSIDFTCTIPGTCAIQPLHYRGPSTVHETQFYPRIFTQH